MQGAPQSQQPTQHSPFPPIGTESICGFNSLVADDSKTNCRIVSTYPNGAASSCSAWKFGDKLLGTAGKLLTTDLTFFGADASNPAQHSNRSH